MSEDATYIKLKSITREQAEILCDQAYTDLCIDIELDSRGRPSGVPFGTLVNRANEILRPYGWSYERLYPEFFEPGNFS